MLAMTVSPSYCGARHAVTCRACGDVRAIPLRFDDHRRRRRTAARARRRRRADARAAATRREPGATAPTRRRRRSPARRRAAPCSGCGTDGPRGTPATARRPRPSRRQRRSARPARRTVEQAASEQPTMPTSATTSRQGAAERADAPESDWRRAQGCPSAGFSGTKKSLREPLADHDAAEDREGARSSTTGIARNRRDARRRRASALRPPAAPATAPRSARPVTGQAS